MRLFFAAFALSLSTVLLCGGSASAGCVVADPTTTPLNYRTAPNGQILGNLENGLRVRIIDSASDENGKPWVYIADTSGQALGWVFRPFINCY